MKPSKNKTIDGKEVAEIRRRAGLSQPQFAEELGVSLWTVRAWEQETNKRQPPKAMQKFIDLKWGKKNVTK